MKISPQQIIPIAEKLYNNCKNSSDKFSYQNISQRIQILENLKKLYKEIGDSASAESTNRKLVIDQIELNKFNPIQNLSDYSKIHLN